MKITGEYIGRLTSKCKSSALIDRVLEVYATKTKLKFYFFNSSTMNWHKKSNLIYSTIILKGSYPEKTLFDTIKKIEKDYQINLSGTLQM